MMKLKPVALQQAINNSIDGMRGQKYCAESFAIYDADGVQVQVIVTKEPEDFFDTLLPEYVEAEA
jgi:hypothetical protein